MAAAIALCASRADAQVVARTVPGVGTSPNAVVVNPANGKVYVASHADGAVRVFDQRSATLLATITFPQDPDPAAQPTSLALSPRSNSVFVGTDTLPQPVFLIGPDEQLSRSDDPRLPAGAVSGLATQGFAIDAANNRGYAFTIAGLETGFAELDGTNVGFVAFGSGGFHSTSMALDPLTGFTYFSDTDLDNAVERNDPQGNRSSIAIGTTSTAVAVNAVTGKVYVGLSGTQGVLVMDPDGTNQSTIPCCSSPSTLLANPATNRIYVANDDGTVTVIDGSSNTTTTSIAVGPAGGTLSLALDPVRDVIYVANSAVVPPASNGVVAIDGSDNSTVDVAVGSNPSSIAVNPLNGRVFVTNAGDDSLSIIDGRAYGNMTVAAGGATAAAVNPLTGRAYFLSPGSPGMLTAIDEAAETIVAAVPVGNAPAGEAIDFALDRIYVTNQADDSVSAVDGASNVATAVALGDGGHPAAIAVNPATHKVYVLEPDLGAARVIDGTQADLATPSAATVALGPSPSVIAVNAATNKIYVGDSSGTDTVRVIDGASDSAAPVTNGPATLAASDIAVNPVTNRIYAAAGSAGTVVEFDGSTDSAIQTYDLHTTALGLAVDSLHGLVYVATGGTSLGVIDPSAASVTLTDVGIVTNSVSMDEVANRLYVGTSDGIVVLDGETLAASRNAARTTTSAPGRPAVDPVLGEAWAAVPGGADVLGVKEAPAPSLAQHAVAASLPFGNLTSALAPDITATVCCSYAPTEAPVRTVDFATQGLDDAISPSSGSGPFTASACCLVKGLNYVALYAVDGLEGNAVATVHASPSGATYYAGAPTIFPVVVVDPPSLAGGALPGGKQAVAYSQAVPSTGGLGATTFTLTGGALPDGLALSSAGIVSGTPTAAGTFGFTVTATDSSGGSNSASYSITIAIGDPVISVAATFDLGTEPVGGTTTPLPLTVSNAGFGLLHVTVLSITGAETADFSIATSSTTCSAATGLASGASCSVSLTFSPQQANPRSTTLDIASDDPASMHTLVTLTGTGIAALTTPNAFSFTSAANVPRSSVQTSNAATISGINLAVPIHVSNGSYSIGCNGTFVTADGTISNLQTVCVRHTASALFNAPTVTTLTVGGGQATFTSTTTPGVTLSVGATGTGHGTIAGGAIDCPTSCTTTVDAGTMLTLAATPDASSVFVPGSWIGCDSFTGDQCMVTMNASRSVSATFTAKLNVASTTKMQASTLFAAPGAPVTFTVHVTPASPTPTGPVTFFLLGPQGVISLGTVALDASGFAVLTTSSLPAGTQKVFADYAGDATYATSFSDPVTLDITNSPPPTPPDAFAFTPVANVARSSVQTSNAVTITGLNQPVAISVANGEYSIGCNATFTASAGTIANLQTVCVRHTASSLFNTATVTTLTIGGVQGTFTSTTTAGATLTVLATGSGSGTISGGGISCPGTCSTTLDDGTLVTLFAAANAGSTFAGWTGCDSAAGTQCTITMNASRSVEATFTENLAAASTTNLSASTATATLGTSVTFSATVAGAVGTATGTVTFSDELNGGGAVTLGTAPLDANGRATFSTTSLAAGVHEVAASYGGDSAYAASSSAQVAVEVTSNPPRLGNISTRMEVLTGNNVMIGGFIIGGSTSKTVAITATGPSLAPFGISNFLPNPTLTLVRSSDQAVVASNDDWQTDANASLLQASGFAPASPRDSGLYVTLAPGAYTAIVRGVGGTIGVSVIGVFEVDHPETPLVNISSRGLVQTGNNVMIGGFIIDGDQPQTVAITATGPSLASFGISNFLANPNLTIVRSSDQSVIATNDDWQSDANAAQLQASGFAPPDPVEAGLILTLQPGAYTAIVRGQGGSTGVSVVGVFRVP